MFHIPVATVEEFRHQAVKILEKHGETHESDRPPMMICLDSLGMLSTTKEMTDISEDTGKRDMTKEKETKPEGVKNKYIDHVETERLADLARERERDRLQFEMFDDPTMNWSGRR